VSIDGNAFFWDFEKNHNTQLLNSRDISLGSVSITADCSVVAIAMRDGKIALLNTATDHTNYVNYTKNNGDTYPLSVSLTKSGNHLAAGYRDGTVLFVDRMSNETAFIEAEPVPIHSIDISDGGEFVLIGSDSGTLMRWDQASGLATIFKHDSPIYKVKLLNDTTYVFSTMDSKIIFGDLKSGTELLQIKTKNGWPIRDFTISPDNTKIAAASSDGSVLVYDLYTGGKLAHLRYHSNSVNSVDFIGNDRLLSSGSDSVSVLWKLNENRGNILQISCHSVPFVGNERFSYVTDVLDSENIVGAKFPNDCSKYNPPLPFNALVERL
jgi:WD40 repeat protein